MQFLDVKTDYAFKKVFGSEQSKNILISFLNSLLGENNQDKHIKAFYILESNQLSIIATTVNNEKLFIIFKNTTNIDDINLQNNIDDIDKILNKNNINWNYCDIYLNFFICINFIVFKRVQNDFLSFMFVPDNLTMRLELKYFDVFLELDKFSKELNQLDTLRDQWLYFIKNAESLSYIPQQFNSYIQDAFKSVNIENLTKEELSLLKKDDFNKGVKKGIEQGREEERNQLIEKAYKKGLSIDVISSLVDMSEEKVLNFIESIKDKNE